MRFIRQADVQVRLPNDWDTQVKDAKSGILAKVRQAARDARAQGKTGADFRKAVCKAAHKAINEADGVWSNAKNALARVSEDKCWYCECKEDRSDLHVDHFRPKGRVTGEQNHPGYWWLALEWKNFRLACTNCNCVREDSEIDEDGGKGNKFPIIPPPPRMRGPKDERDRTSLLDPVVRTDVEKLTFTRNGLPKPVTNDDTSEDWRRVQDTIEVFHLRETRLKRARETLAIDIDDEVRIATECLDRGDLRSFTTISDKLLARIRLDAKYASFARVALGIHRDKEWVEDLWKHL